MNLEPMSYSDYVARRRASPKGDEIAIVACPCGCSQYFVVPPMKITQGAGVHLEEAHAIATTWQRGLAADRLLAAAARLIASVADCGRSCAIDEKDLQEFRSALVDVARKA